MPKYSQLGLKKYNIINVIEDTRLPFLNTILFLLFPRSFSNTIITLPLVFLNHRKNPREKQPEL